MVTKVAPIVFWVVTRADAMILKVFARVLSCYYGVLTGG